MGPRRAKWWAAMSRIRPTLFRRAPRGMLRPTERAREALGLYCDGLTQREIATQYGVTVRTVDAWLKQCTDADRDERMTQ